VRGDQLGANATHRLARLDKLGLREEGPPGREHLLGPQLSARRERRHVGLGTRLAPLDNEVVEGTHESVDLSLAVRECDQRHDAPVIGELDIDLALVAQPIIGLITGQPY
jgi:hypothetical protein